MTKNNLFNIDEFHFGDNLFIDASAGTGKTYTIQQLVAKLVRGDKRHVGIPLLTRTRLQANFATAFVKKWKIALLKKIWNATARHCRISIRHRFLRFIRFAKKCCTTLHTRRALRSIWMWFRMTV